MKGKIFYAFFAITLLWATVATYLYIKLKLNPPIVPIAIESSKEGYLQSFRDLEKIGFLRQFLDGLINYSHKNYWQSQSQLTQLMAPLLAQERISEIQKTKEKFSQNEIVQSGLVLTIWEVSANEFLANIKIENIDKSQKKKTAFLTLEVQTINTERTMENPWGILAKSIRLKSSALEQPAFDKTIYVEKDRTTLLTFPCFIENVENSEEQKIKIKITTFNISELQVTPNDLSTANNFKAICSNSEFKFDLSSGKNKRTLFVQIPKEVGSQREKIKSDGKNKIKDIYDRTIEKALGIQLDN